jgi:mono/diheme cytochrome c family protein
MNCGKGNIPAGTLVLYAQTLLLYAGTLALYRRTFALYLGTIALYRRNIGLVRWNICFVPLNIGIVRPDIWFVPLNIGVVRPNIGLVLRNNPAVPRNNFVVLAVIFFLTSILSSIFRHQNSNSPRMKKVLRVILIIITVIILALAGIVTYVKTALPNVGAAPDIKVDTTPERVARGQYLANHVTVCMDCHSKRDYTLYSGPIIPGTFGGGGELFDERAGLPGTIYSKNITPYNLSKWTDGEIFRTITTGVTKEGKALFPLMPYHSYGKMDKEDVYCIIAYLRTLTPSTNEPPETQLNFPVNIIVNTIPEKAQLTTKPDSTNTLAYGKYMVNASGCVECHTKFEKGALVAGTEFGGGRVFKLPCGDITTANISPDKETGIGNWTKEQFIQRFKMYSDSSYKPAKLAATDFNTVMPWMMYTGMKESDLAAIFTYLQSVKPQKNAVVKFIKKS